jgi:hypothetical protein
MGNFQVYDALSIFFELEKLHVEHLDGFIFLSRESGELQNFFFELLTRNSNLKTRKNSPTRSAKVNASTMGGMFVVATMSC